MNIGAKGSDSNHTTSKNYHEKSDLSTIENPTSSLLSRLQDYSDFLNAFIQADEISTSVAWLKADILLKMYDYLGGPSIKELSKDVNVPVGTINNYIRVALAFPKDQRDQRASFSLCFQASLADEFDLETKTFTTQERYVWLEKALDNDYSARQLSNEIYNHKQIGLLSGAHCVYCNKTGVVEQYIFHLPRNRDRVQKLELHEDCYWEIVRKILDGRQSE